MSSQCLLLQSLIFLILKCFLVHKCFATSLLTDDYRDKSDQTSISNALKQMNVDVLRQLVNQESLLRLSLSKTVQAILQDVSNLKEKQEKTEKELKNLKEKNEHLKEQVSMCEKQVSDMNATIRQKSSDEMNILNEINDLKNHKVTSSQTIADMKNEIRYMSFTLLDVKKRNEEMASNIPQMVESRFRDVNNTIQSIKFDIIQTQTQNNQNQLEDFRLNISRLINGNEKRNEKIASNIPQMVESSFRDMNNTIQSMKSDMSQIQTQNNDISRLINDEIRRVGFTAGAKSNNKNWSGTKLIFPRVTYAVGGGYDNKTGVFTSPIQGDFVFFLSVVSYAKQYLYLDITLNGVSKVRAMAYDGNYAEASNLVYLHLKKGDRVSVERHDGKGYATFTSITLMSFSGFKI